MGMENFMFFIGGDFEFHVFSLMNSQGMAVQLENHALFLSMGMRLQGIFLTGEGFQWLDCLVVVYLSV